ncbi:MAG: type II secretion system F family protein [Peptoniphilaceae bacterium]
MRFTYKAFDKNKKIIQDTIYAKDENEAKDKLKDMSLRPISIKESIEINKKLHLNIKIFNNNDIYLFLYQLYVLINSNISIVNTFEIISSNYKGKKKEIILKIYSDLLSAEELSDSLKNTGIFPIFLINMIKIGEKSSNLSNVLYNLSQYYKKRTIFENKVKNALTYPVLLIIVTIIIVNFLVLNILPTFAEIFKDNGMDLPLLTRILINSSSFILHNILFIIFLIFILIIFFMLYFSTIKGKLYIDSLKLKINVYKIILVKNFLSQLKFLLNSGTNIPESIEVIISSTENLALRKCLEEVLKDLYRGESLSRALGKYKIFSELVISMIKVGEESSNMKDIVSSIDELLEYELETNQHKFIVLIESIMILIISIFIGFILISIALPMFDLVNNFN